MKNTLAGAAGLAICTFCMAHLFEHSWGCDPYNEFLRPPLGMQYALVDCFTPALLGPADLFGGVFALLGMFLVARISTWPPERAAVSVGVVGTLLAALVGSSSAVGGLLPHSTNENSKNDRAVTP